MAKIKLPIVGQSYHLPDWSIDCQRSINLYPQVIESGNTPYVSALLPTAGLVKKHQFSGAIRGLYAFADYALCAAGTNLYRIALDGSSSLIGTIDGTELVSISDNGLVALIVSDSATYSYNLDTKLLTQIIDEGFLSASSVTFVDSRFVVTIPKTGRIQWSGLLNTNFSALAYATAEGRPDNLVKVIANQRELWLLGEQTAEVWFGTGDKDLPFQRMQGAFLTVGCAAKNSAVLFGSLLVWLSKTEAGQGQIVMTQGYQVQRISNHAIESAISNYERIDDAIAYCYQQDGHSFYALTFPTANITWCYDAITQMWHERAWLNTDYKLDRHRSITHCFFNGEHLVGDHSNGIVYRLCPHANTDNGQPMFRQRITPCLGADGTRIKINSLEIKAQVGQDSNTEPLCMLDWSDDCGRTWSGDRQISMGKIGEFKRRLMFRRLGMARDRVFRFTVTDNVRLVLLDARLDAEGMNS